jgi:hypothetical protein
MANQQDPKQQKQQSQSDLAGIKERLRQGKLSQDDIKSLESIVTSAEEATRALRAAIVE